MIDAPYSRAVIWAVIMAPVGFTCGVVYFAALREGCARLLSGRRGVLALAAARFGAVVALLILAAHHGAAALLALFAGFVVARSFTVGHARRLHASAGSGGH